MRVTGVDACRRGWVAVSLDGPEGPAEVRVHETLAGALDGDRGPRGGHRHAAGPARIGLARGGPGGARAARAQAQLGLRDPAPDGLEQASYQAASQRCRELTGQGLSVQAWGLRTRLLEADRYRGSCPHPLYEVHPELAFRAMAGAPLAYSKHTPAGRELRRELLSRAGIELPPIPGARAPRAPVTDTLDAAAVAWSAWRIATGRAVIIPDRPQRDDQGLQIAIRY